MVVTVGGVASNGVSFTVTVPAPRITSLTPTSGAVGTAVTITGTNFGATQGHEHGDVQRDGGDADELERDEHRGAGAGGATTGNVVVTVGGVASNGVQLHGDGCRRRASRA